MAQVTSGATSDKWTIDATSKAGRTTLYDANGNLINPIEGAAIPAAGQGLDIVGGIDHDTVRRFRVDKSGAMESVARRLRVFEPIEGATLNSQRWTSTLTTQTITQAAISGITLNGSAITTINTGSLLTSRAQFSRLPGQTLHWFARIRHTLVANQEGTWGLAHQGTLSATAAIEQGFIWSFNTAGTLFPIWRYNSTDAVVGTDFSGSLTNTNYYDYHIYVDDDRALFVVCRSDTGAVVNSQLLRIPLTQQRYVAVSHLYDWFRVRNSGSAPASAGQAIIADHILWSNGDEHGVPHQKQLSEIGYTGAISPTAYTQSTQFSNSAAPGNATLSNTAASYSTLGGLYRVAATASAATDYSFFSFAVPAPYRLKVFGARISMWNEGAAAAATPASTLFWGIGYNGASANLATGGHIRLTLGTTTLPISAAIGAGSPDLDIDFDVPIVSEPGTHCTVILRVVGGAATASEFWAGNVHLKAAFE